MDCPHCGTRLLEGDIICFKCRQKLPKSHRVYEFEKLATTHDKHHKHNIVKNKDPLFNIRSPLFILAAITICGFFLVSLITFNIFWAAGGITLLIIFLGLGYLMNMRTVNLRVKEFIVKIFKGR